MTQLSMLSADATAPAVRGRCHVHFGAWRDQEPDWPRPFVYVSDVPYGIRYKSGFTFDARMGGTAEENSRTLPTSIAGDRSTAERDEILNVKGGSAAAICGPGDIRKTPPNGLPKAVLIVDKGEGAGMGDLSFPWRPNYETVAIYGGGWRGKRTTSILRGEVLGFSNRSTAGGRRHPHEKPMSVVTELCSKAPPGLPIVAPFMGRGTTAVACALLGREFWGAEIDPQYFDIIRGRLAAVGAHI